MQKQIDEVMGLVEEYKDVAIGGFSGWDERMAIESKLRELLPGWEPIESAPKDVLVMVYTPPQEGDWPDGNRIDFDYIDTGIAEDYWYNHGEHYEHFCCVSKPEGSVGPKEKAPYTHWMHIPKAPS